MPIELTFPKGGALMAGGTGTIGRGVVEGLCRAGVPVLFTYRGAGRHDSEAIANDLVERLSAQGCRIRARKMDMRDTRQVEEAMDEVVEWTGRLHSVMTTAGAIPIFAKTGDYEVEKLAAFIDGDFMAYFRLFRSAIQRMRASGGGSLTCTTTIDVGKLALYNGASGMSKGAVEAMMRHIASEEAQAGIRANYVRIGWVGDDSFDDHPEWREPPEGPEPVTQAEMLAHIARSHMDAMPMQRPGNLREVGDVFAFLASEQASYLTGQCIKMDGAEDR
ncbi:short-chain dehydrogenase [Novosphingobium marinum]|uniref:NAD(P)-dependent dehydrogenase (Short-subunit alcohol dehydrogenase family) n=1 Tax=Novosphingobium marinum TaxID=1514948 RepID=A0A7Y9Y101_9SPHN|nr:SDR family oxidoreductase [Novosphingobium marinum]NYH96748.1 NAD(P)-dependent dehydrogenase (short-subunit alcohol dehydrogenase family) [Novosphingobium marinum]GGC40527.1 short-chain dehydrogenase [Novosphingobium marinum]